MYVCVCVCVRVFVNVYQPVGLILFRVNSNPRVNPSLIVFQVLGLTRGLTRV